MSAYGWMTWAVVAGGAVAAYKIGGYGPWAGWISGVCAGMALMWGAAR